MKPGMVADLSGLREAKAALVRRARETLVAEYRDIVKEIFWRILHQTPQFSGRAVAHWQVGIDVPDLSYHNQGIGKVVNPVTGRHKKDGAFYKQDAALRKGDEKYIQVAWQRNLPKFELIKRNSKVFFTNAVRGDTDNGESSAFYLQDLQEEDYWMAKLRPGINTPYQTAAETVMMYQLELAVVPGKFKRGSFTFRGSRDSYKGNL